MSTPAPGVLSRRSHTGGAREEGVHRRRAQRNNTARMASKKPSSTQNTTLQTLGMDVIKQYPGPLTVSRAVKLAVKSGDVSAPGQALPHLTGAEQNASYAGTAVEFTVKYGNVSAPSAAPSSTSPDPSSSDAAASAAPSSGSAGPSTSGHAADPPSADPLAVASTCRCSSAPVFSRTRHTLHE